MTADLSREEIAFAREFGPQSPVMKRVIDAAEAHRDEPTRLAAARAKGYREGVEAAIADAVAVSIRDEVDSYEMRDDGGGGYSPTDDERIMLEDFGAGLVAVFEQRLRALTPPPAEPAQPDGGWIEWKGGNQPVPDVTTVHVRYRDGSENRSDLEAADFAWERTWHADPCNIIAYRIVKPAEPAGGTAEPADWTVSDTELARDILCYLGIGSDASLEPGDRRRDRIAAMICADRELRIVKPATRITALEAENAALKDREADRRRARPLPEWHDDIGPVLWWSFPIEEAPFSGDPRGDDWPGYHTHWTPLLDCPADPGALLQGQGGGDDR